MPSEKTGPNTDLRTLQVVIPDELIFQDLDGETVLLDMKSGQYFGMDETGSRIWKLLGEYDNLQEVLDALLAEYDVAADICRQELLAFLENLETSGLVTVETAES